MMRVYRIEQGLVSLNFDSKVSGIFRALVVLVSLTGKKYRAKSYDPVSKDTINERKRGKECATYFLRQPYHTRSLDLSARYTCASCDCL